MSDSIIIAMGAVALLVLLHKFNVHLWRRKFTPKGFTSPTQAQPPWDEAQGRRDYEASKQKPRELK